jgi:hypothetical protein
MGYMNGEWNPEPIKQLLNSSLEQIDHSTLAGLHAARDIAVSRVAARPAVLSLLAPSGLRLTRNAWAHGHKPFNWLGIILVAICTVNGFVYFWQQAMNDDSTDVDVEILTDDLPIDYWLR